MQADNHELNAMDLDEPKIPGAGHRPRRPHLAGSLVFLALVVAFVAYGLYRYQFKPLLTMRLPDHVAQPPDAPPLELTSFQVRLDGRDVVPAAVAARGDSIYVGFTGVPALQIYSLQLALLRTIRLERPSAITPNAIAVTDSLLIVADSAAHLITIYDREGDFINLVQWYPDRGSRVTPTAVSSDGRRLAVVDDAVNRVALISLVDEQPFYTFLELLELFPPHSGAQLVEPRFAFLAPDNKIWVGETDQVRLFSVDGRFLTTAEAPPRTRIVRPIAAALAGDPSDPAQCRVHVLDRVAGKVFVYDLTATLRLVYPRDRALLRPSSIAIDNTNRTIFITETESASITAFGF